MSERTTIWDAIDALRETRLRYAREAYAFVLAALQETVERLPEERRADVRRRHLSGRELLVGMVALARREFGPMAATVFREWGVRSSEDVGEIVFEFVRAGQLSARPEDTMDDFRGYDLEAGLRPGAEESPPPAGGAGPRRAPAA